MNYPLARAVGGVDHTGQLRDAHVHRREGHNFALVQSERFLRFKPELHPFLSDTFGAAMNQNIAFSGEPTIIHAGVNSGALRTGTTDGVTTNHLIDAGTDFTSAPIVVVGMSVKNTTSGNEYALVTAVANGDLTLDTDIFVSGETYEINPIWVGTASGGTWNFADSGKITITLADNNDRADFENDTGPPTQSWDVSKNGFTTFTGKVDLDTYNATNNSILVQFGLNGVTVGNQLNLNVFIDTGNFSEQSFVIPVGDFEFGTDIINELSIIITRSGGTKPTIKFDDFQWEEVGASEIYKATTPVGTKLHVSEIRIAIADDETGIVTVAGATENHSMINLGYNKLLSISVLSNGIVFRQVEDGKIVSSLTIRQLGDFLASGSDLIDVISDGTNTFLTLVVRFPEPIILKGTSTQDFLSFTINDNLSSLLQFTAAARGAIEI